MDIQFLTKFKNQLINLKNFLQERVRNLQKVKDFGSDIDSGDEEMDETEEFSNQLSIAQNYKEKLADVEVALDKMNKNTYGICEKCGKKISQDVLEAVPESKLCKECKKSTKN